MVFFTHVLIFALTTGTIGSSFERSSQDNHPTLEVLEKALNTNESFWLEERTYEITGHTCVYTKMSLLQGHHYEFDQHYKKDGRQVQRHLHAELSDGPEGAVMKVGRKAGPKIPYTLKYWEDDEKCGILMLTKEGEEHCELHVWNSHIQSDISKCKEAYHTFCPARETHKVYKQDCNELRQ
uniref:Lipocalin n=1 Tax=Rhipicephalus zambeziensis TaxID=60191 RepID=A0A224YE58_9ACAR